MRIGSFTKHTIQAIAEGSLIAILIVGLMAGSVLAAKPATAGARGPSAGTVWFEPVSTSVGSDYVIAGTGFKANNFVSVGARYGDVTWWASGPADDQGSFRFTLTATTAGSIVHDIYEKARNGYRFKTAVILQVDQ